MLSYTQTAIINELNQSIAYQFHCFYLTQISLNSEDVLFLFNSLKKNPKITELHLYDLQFHQNALTVFANQLGENASFTNLCLHGLKIQEQEAALLAQALKKNTHLTTLSLSNNKLEEKGTKKIAAWLKDHHSLTSLSISTNCIGNEGAKYIAEALEEHPSLLSLTLSSNNIEDTGAQHIASALARNKSIKTLNLENNDIEVSGALAIADALKQNEHLCNLNLERNRIKEGGALAIIEALNTHNKIDTLNVNFNQITAQDSSKFIAALETNTSLKSLSLASNKLGDKGAEVIATVLKANRSLQSLDITNNSMTDAGIISIAQALRINKYLYTVSLFFMNNINEKGIESIEKALSFNKHLRATDYLTFIAHQRYDLKDKIGTQLQTYSQRNENIAQTLLTKLAENSLSHPDYIAIAEYKESLLTHLKYSDSWKRHPAYKELPYRIKNIEEEFSRDFLKKAGITKNTEITAVSKENTSVTLPQEVLYCISKYVGPKDIKLPPLKSQQSSEATSLQSSVNVTNTTISNQDNPAAMSNLPPSEAQGQAAPSKTTTKSWLGQIKDFFVSWVKSIANSVTNLFASKTTNNTSAKGASSLNKDSNQCNHPAKEANILHSSPIAGKVEEQHHSPTKSWTDYITGLLSSKTNQNNLAHNPTSSSKGRF